MKNKIQYLISSISFIAFISFFICCEKLLPGAPDPEDTIAEPIEGLTPAQLVTFLAGDELFAKVYSADLGLGPVFIQNSCEGCHVGDGKGHPFNMETRFGKYSGFVFDEMLDKGGPQLQQRSIAAYPSEQLPSDYTHKTGRIAPIVIGMGFLATLHDSTILDMADPFDLNGDGISGRVNYVLPKEYFTSQSIHIDSSGYYIGRFGKKAKEITLLDQVVFALKQDIGLTSDFDIEDIFNPLAGINSGDVVPDPEVSLDVVNALVFYMRTLKTPTRRNEDDPDVLAGEKLFTQIGCVNCHKPNLTTAKSEIEALSEKVFHPYTDLLLHDMGPALAFTTDGYPEIPEGSAQGSEWRTPPLWGLGLAKESQGGTAYYLHDGRATDLRKVIDLHIGGEATVPASKFFSLSEGEKEQLIKFLNSL
ncbi:MAG: c-type cytochrome [Bacteroidetes bacterium]|nr:c-type cytochrome [Bacteroidota bacterium]